MNEYAKQLVFASPKTLYLWSLTSTAERADDLEMGRRIASKYASILRANRALALAVCRNITSMTNAYKLRNDARFQAFSIETPELADESMKSIKKIIDEIDVPPRSVHCILALLGRLEPKQRELTVALLKTRI